MSITTITLDFIKAEQVRLAALIAAFEAQRPTEYGIPAAMIELQPGESYAGIVLDDEGQPQHHLVLLPGQIEDADWETALAWAKQEGGELPTRQEQALLYANQKPQFGGACYWSCEAYNSGSAWYQYFGYGTQRSLRKGALLRARAVRRLPI